MARGVVCRISPFSAGGGDFASTHLSHRRGRARLLDFLLNLVDLLFKKLKRLYWPTLHKVDKCSSGDKYSIPIRSHAGRPQMRPPLMPQKIAVTVLDCWEREKIARQEFHYVRSFVRPADRSAGSFFRPSLRPAATDDGGLSRESRIRLKRLVPAEGPVRCGRKNAEVRNLHEKRETRLCTIVHAYGDPVGGGRPNICNAILRNTQTQLAVVLLCTS